MISKKRYEDSEAGERKQLVYKSQCYGVIVF